MTEYELQVLRLLTVIANGQSVMLAVMPKMIGMDSLVSDQRELCASVVASLTANAESVPSCRQSVSAEQDQAHDGTGEQKGE